MITGSSFPQFSYCGVVQFICITNVVMLLWSTTNAGSRNRTMQNPFALTDRFIYLPDYHFRFPAAQCIGLEPMHPLRWRRLSRSLHYQLCQHCIYFPRGTSNENYFSRLLHSSAALLFTPVAPRSYYLLENGPYRTRTCDNAIKSRVLYQLS